MAEVPAKYIKNKVIDFDGEIFASMGLPVKIAGLLLYPPSIGVFSLLETIDAIFIKDFEIANSMDLYRALYIMFKRKKAACEVRNWLQSGGREKFKIENRDSWLPWDFKVAKFAKKAKFDFWNFCELRKLATGVTFNGYEMIPSLGGGGGEYLFGADAIASIFRLAGPVVNSDFEKVVWDLPLCLVGHIAALESQSNGVKGVCRPKDIDDMKLQFKLANEREKNGELHPWQIEQPHVYRPNEKQIKANPEIKKEHNAAMKAYLQKLREEKAEKEAKAKGTAA